MSVTFAPSILTTPVYVFTCACGASKRSESYNEAADAYDEHFYAPGCSDLTQKVSTEYEDARMGDQVNLANTNAAELLDLLGLSRDGEIAGSTSAEDFTGRVLLAKALNRASGWRPKYTEGNFTDLGRKEEYFRSVLDQLHQTAESARSLGVEVAWS